MPRSSRPALLQDFEAAKARQDMSLDTIDRGLTALRGIGEAMGETLQQQDIVLDAIHERVRLPWPGACPTGGCWTVCNHAAWAIRAKLCMGACFAAHLLLRWEGCMTCHT